MFNLVNDPQYYDLLTSLKMQLAQWRDEQGDTISVNAYYKADKIFEK